MAEGKKPNISVAVDGPYIVKGLKELRGPDGPLPIGPTGETVALCRCGASKNKPFCDGQHAKIGFSGENTADASANKRKTYTGETITVHDNRSVCAHAGFCTEGLSSVFRMKERPWIDPDAASVEAVIAIVEKCPSGALSYSRGDVEHRGRSGEASILVAKNGPYVVSGDAELVDVPRGEGALPGQITLCRCGGSKNKPFCDGAHWNISFDEDR